MRKTVLVLACLILAAAPAGALGQGMSGHGGHGGGGAAPGGASAPGGLGQPIQEATVEGYAIAWRLLMLDKAVDGNDHHLMVFLKGPDGKPVAGAKVGFQVTAPGAAKPQSVLCDPMDEGYGANVRLSGKGPFSIRTKVVAGPRTLNHEFPYEPKGMAH